MKKNNTHNALSIFLLAIMLLGNVGVHIFHHHESVRKETSLEEKTDTSIALAEVHEEHVDCLLCKYDSFREITLESSLQYTFLSSETKSLYGFIVPITESFLIFSDSRGPPNALNFN